MRANRKIIHDIKGKLSPFKTLLHLLETQYDDDLIDTIGVEGHKKLQDLIEPTMKLAMAKVPEILALLDEIQ